MAEVLLVEDDEAIGGSLGDALCEARHGVRWCRDGASAIAAAEAAPPPDLVILDLGLPDLDGVDVCRAIRARLPEALIIILTARDAEIDVIVGLESGADDYLTKPIGASELLARIRAHLRRTLPAPRAASSTAIPRQVGALRVDVAARRVWLGDAEIALRAKQFDLLARLVAEPGAAVSRQALMADVWDENWFGSTKTLDVHVAALRRHLAEAARANNSIGPEIVTLRGYGYRLDPADVGQHGTGIAPGRFA